MSEITDLTAAINRLAAAIEGSGTPVKMHFAASWPTHPAASMPAPRGYMCAAGCRHGIAVHREHGCDVDGCDCPAPFGRIVQPDLPDDASGLAGEVTP